MEAGSFDRPEIVGPGIWFAMHLAAARAKSPESVFACTHLIETLCDNFRCARCQGHFRRFLDKHPFEDYADARDLRGRHVGIFKWTWELHDAVNRVLSKPRPTLEEAYDYFALEGAVCTNCGVPEHNSGDNSPAWGAAPALPRDGGDKHGPAGKRVLYTLAPTKSPKPSPLTLPTSALDSHPALTLKSPLNGGGVGTAAPNEGQRPTVFPAAVTLPRQPTAGLRLTSRH